MRKNLIIFMLLLTACGQPQTPPGNTDKQADISSAESGISIDFVTGQFDYRTHPDFVRVDSQYSERIRYLHKETYEAFKKMYASAKEDGVILTIVSAARNFDDQKAIWEGKWENIETGSGLEKALQILEYSSMPMTSRHHWGTDIDLINLNNSYFESGQGLKEYQWLKAHANDFGFYQPYTDKSLNERTGYNMEKWHWSYIPLADKYLQYYNQHITNEDITGFKGSELAKEIDMVGNYVNGVSVKIKEYD